VRPTAKTVRGSQPESDLKSVGTVGFRFWNSGGEKKQWRFLTASLGGTLQPPPRPLTLRRPAPAVFAPNRSRSKEVAIPRQLSRSGIRTEMVNAAGVTPIPSVADHKGQRGLAQFRRFEPGTSYPGRFSSGRAREKLRRPFLSAKSGCASSVTAERLSLQSSATISAAFPTAMP
jgi:hypothetical protein